MNSFLTISIAWISEEFSKYIAINSAAVINNNNNNDKGLIAHERPVWLETFLNQWYTAVHVTIKHLDNITEVWTKTQRFQGFKQKGVF